MTESRYIHHVIEREQTSLTDDDILADWAALKEARKNGKIYTGLDTLHKMK